MSETKDNLRTVGFLFGWSLIPFGFCLMAVASNLEFLLVAVIVVLGAILIYISYFGLILPKLGKGSKAELKEKKSESSR